jgi:hypothetical protein
MKKKKLTRAEIEQRDALVVLCQQPRLETELGVQIIRARRFWYYKFFHLRIIT